MFGLKMFAKSKTKRFASDKERKQFIMKKEKIKKRIDGFL